MQIPADTTRDGWSKGDCESTLSEIRDTESNQLPGSVLITAIPSALADGELDVLPVGWRNQGFLNCLQIG